MFHLNHSVVQHSFVRLEDYLDEILTADLWKMLGLWLHFYTGDH
jgi:hypothetical protein